MKTEITKKTLSDYGNKSEVVNVVGNALARGFVVEFQNDVILEESTIIEELKFWGIDNIQKLDLLN